MKTVNLEELRKKVDEIGGCNADEAYAAGWDNAISEVISVLDDVAYDSCVLYKVGSQIEVDLDGLGVFTATAQKITEDHVVFMFDDCIASMPMNNTKTNEGGYQKSGLCYWINTVLRKAFPEEIRQHLTDISIPTYGQIFGHDELYHVYLETDKDEQFELMKKRKNRIADYENKINQLNSDPKPGTEIGHGYGISNVASRLKLIYGTDYLPFFESIPDQYTSVTIIIPIE